jgi:hypothetical protein
VKRLITDRDILTGSVSGRIVLDENTLITPSARDRAAKLGLEIVEAGAADWHALPPTAAAANCARCGSATCSGGCSNCGSGVALKAGGQNAATLGALADGLYLVRVAGGQAVSVLPATGPGLMRRAGG